MILTPPNYVLESGVQTTPVNYEWSDEKEEEIYLRPDERLGTKIHAIADRAEIALALGMAEWIAWRLHSKLADPVLLNFIEAIWAGIIDWRYIAGAEGLSEKAWHGPIRGPIRITFNQLIEVVQLVASKQFAHPEIVCISRVAEYILPDPGPFRSWRRTVIARLTKEHPKKPPKFWGDPVPRSAVDPASAYSAVSASAEIQEFLDAIKGASNPFLNTPARMKAAGFKGTPYQIKR